MQDWMWWALGAVVLLLLLKPKVPADAKLSPQDVKDAMENQKDLQLIDVRTSGEYGGGHLRGAKNISLDRIGAHLADLSKEKPLIVYCRSGQRSASALKTLRDAGFSQAKHLQGGIGAWQGAGLSVIR